MKRTALIIGSWLSAGVVIAATVGEIKLAIWLGVAAAFLLFVAIVEGRES